MKKVNKQIVLALAGLLFASQPGQAQEPVRIVATTSLLASIAEELVGDAGDVFYIASPKRDLHKVAPTPKDVLKTRKADIFIYHGLQAEPWLLPLLNAAGRSDFLDASAQAIDASEGIEALEVPKEVTRLEGDIHPHGNPHYWLDPRNVKKVAENVASNLSALYPNHAEEIIARLEKFQSSLDQRIVEWDLRMRPFQGISVVSYHRSWTYFFKVYDLKVVGEVEPKPGIPVTSKHLSDLTHVMNTEDVKIIITEPYQSDKPVKKLSENTGAKVVELSQFPRARKGIINYEDLMEDNISQIESVMK